MCNLHSPPLGSCVGLSHGGASRNEESEESAGSRQRSKVSAESGFSRSSFPASWSLFRFSGAVFSMFLQTPGFFKLFPPPKNLIITVDIFPLILQGLNRNNSPFVLPPCLDTDLSRLGAELSWSQLWALFQARKRELFPSGLFPVPGGSWGWEIRNYLPQDSHPTSPGRGETCLDPGIRSRLGAPGLGSVAEIEFLCALRDFVAILG